MIQWIADSGLVSGDYTSPKIPLSNIYQVERRRLAISRYTCIFIRTRPGDAYGPFEFAKGGSRDFIEKLRKYIDLQELSSNPGVYKVIHKTNTYQLPTSVYSSSPMNMIQGVGTKLLNVFDSLRLGADSALSGTGGFTPSAAFRADDRCRHSPGADGFLDPDLAAQKTMMDKIYADRLHLIDSLTSTTAPDDADYQIISHTPIPLSIAIPDLIPVRRKPPLTMEEWQRHLDRDGRVTVVDKLQASIYYGGIDPSLRPVAWKYLFGYLKWDFTAEENANRIEEKHRHYHIMKAFWKSMSLKQMKNFRVFRERKSIIEKDTYRTDRQTAFFKDNSSGALTRLYNILMTYTFYNLDLGYFQGMNDLLAVILTVMDSEEDAFWCFAGLLERIVGSRFTPLAGNRRSPDNHIYLEFRLYL
uniref:Rab-GAP TBC domain-containing protein n=1 Tax=Mesocestoides corti TaxID=53468 RepID=A0A5K3FME6_MESCO